MEIADFIEATNTAASAEEVFSLYLKAASAQGFDRVMYSVLAKKKELSEDQYAPAIVRNYPDDWVKHYVASGYVESDPVRRMCIVARRPFTWAELPKSGYFKKRDLRIFPEAEEAHLYDGVAIPLHGPGGEVFGVGMASSARGAEPERQLSRLNVITVQFHVAYSALAFPAVEAAPAVHLSAREREILQWCIIGKSTWEISQILSASEKTVEWHLGRIYAKLGVSSRVAAVVKALNLGLIAQ
jgi:DNA-binding CsgD family transcriptional regulator